MCMRALPACMSMSSLCAWSLRRSEEGIGFVDLELQMLVDLGLLEQQPVLTNGACTAPPSSLRSVVLDPHHVTGRSSQGWPSFPC